MKKAKLLTSLLTAALLMTSCSKGDKVPLAPVEEVIDEYYGLEIRDPYRYMENMDDTVFLGWMKKYASYTRNVLDEIPGRSELVDQMIKIDSRKTDKVYNVQITENNLYFYLKLSFGDERGKLYYRKGYEGVEKLLFDPDTYSEEERLNYGINWVAPTKNGEYVAIAIAPNGSENTQVMVLNVESGERQGEFVRQTAGRITWLCDNNGYVYTRTNSENIHDPERYLDMSIYYHELGTPQNQDKLVFSSSRYPGLEMQAQEFPYIIYDHYQGILFLAFYTVETNLKVFYAPCNKKELANIHWKPLISETDKVTDFYPVMDSLYLFSAKDASRFRILCTSLSDPDITNARVVVDEHPEGILSGFDFTSKALYYKLKFYGVQEKLYRLPYGSSKAEQIEFPINAGSAWIATRGHKHEDIWITLTGWTLDGKR